MRPPFGSCANAVMPRSISAAFLTPMDDRAAENQNAGSHQQCTAKHDSDQAARGLALQVQKR